jgi:hypothetical protein
LHSITLIVVSVGRSSANTDFERMFSLNGNVPCREQQLDLSLVVLAVVDNAKIRRSSHSSSSNVVVQRNKWTIQFGATRPRSVSVARRCTSSRSLAAVFRGQVLLLLMSNVTVAFDCYYCANCLTTQPTDRLPARPEDWCYVRSSSAT